METGPKPLIFCKSCEEQFSKSDIILILAFLRVVIIRLGKQVISISMVRRSIGLLEVSIFLSLTEVNGTPAPSLYCPSFARNECGAISHGLLMSSL